MAKHWQIKCEMLEEIHTVSTTIFHESFVACHFNHLLQDFYIPILKYLQYLRFYLTHIRTFTFSVDAE